MDCKENQVYDVRAECPKSCLNPEGKGCGQLIMTEGCYCKNGYVQGANNTCISLESCGCEIPGEKIRIQVNKNELFRNNLIV